MRRWRRRRSNFAHEYGQARNSTLELDSSELNGTEMPESIRDRIPRLTDFVLYGDPVAVPEWVGELTNLAKITWLELDGTPLVGDA